MAKKIISLIIVTVLLLGVLPLTAYADDTITVTVITYEPMNPMYTVQVPEGEPYNAPLPVLSETGDGVFVDWYTDLGYKDRYVDGTVLTESITLYPRYAPEDDLVYLKVYLDPDDEYPVVDAVHVKGDLPGTPATPEPAGKEFFGWFADEELMTPFDFTEPLYEDTPIYAKLVAEEDCYGVYIYHRANDAEPTFGIDVPKGDPIPQPADPSIDGMDFYGWYTDRKLTQKADFDSPCYEDVSLYPRFVAEEDCYDVFVYLSPDATQMTYGCSVPKGDPIPEPGEPGADDMYFFGWYTDRGLTQKADFESPHYEDVSLFPRFVAEEDCYDVFIYLSADAAQATSGYSVPKGDPIIKPADPGKPGFDFGGWYTDRELTQPADFVSPRSEDVSLYAKWTGNSDHDLRLVEELPPTATNDGVKSHYECTDCGKLFTNDPSGISEITDKDELVIDATGPYLLGDSDGDGSVSILDATAIQRRLVSLPNIRGFCRGAADVDGDDEVSIFDATGIQRYLASLSCPEGIGAAA